MEISQKKSNNKEISNELRSKKSARMIKETKRKEEQDK